MNQSNDIRPPKWPLRLLRCFVKKEYLEEIEGDMEELFHERAEQGSYRQARRMYTREVLKLFRPVLIKRLGDLQPLHPYGMFRNYFKVSVRGMIKNPFTSFTNLFGLSVAIGICILAYAFARWTYGMDQFHEHKHEVYLATFFAKRDGTVQQFGKTPRPLGEMLKKDFARIKNVCRVEDRNVILKHENKVFHERVRYTDPSFLDMFTFPLKWGSARSLADVNSIILSEDMSIKYFGRENPVGQRVLVKFDRDRGKVFQVTGVLSEFPKASSIHFDFLINFENFRTSDTGYLFQDWNAFVNATLVQVEQPSDVRVIGRGMEKYRKLQNQAAPPDWAISSFAFEPLATLYDRSADIRGSIVAGGSDDNQKSVIFEVFIGAFMLMLACLNYINIAIVTAAKRLKEIGVRKSIGATRRAIAVQFLSENVVTTFFALVMGLCFGYFVAIPWFEDINHFSMGFSLKDVNLWLYLPAILFFTAIASGLYPALYISKFHVVGILKGSVKFGKKNPLTRVFLVFQLILACIFITSAVMFTQNSHYLIHRSWGYDPRQELYVSVPDGAAFEKMRALMMQEPDVVSVAGTSDHLGKSTATAVVHFPGHQYEVEQLSVGPRYFETMGLQLAGGRNFLEHQATDKASVVVNELLVKSLGLKDPIGQTLRMDSVQYRIIGVVKDFYNHSFFVKLKPTLFKMADEQNYRYLAMKVRPGSMDKTYKSVQARWAVLYPDIPFDGGYQEDVWNGFNDEMNTHAVVWQVIATIAILLVSLGLYGLVRLNVAGRVREFSIRKVLGAKLRNIADNVTRPYIIMLTISLVVGAPVSYTLLKLILEFAYPYHMPFNYSGVTIAVFILILVVLATVALQIRKVAVANPVNGLKVE